MLLEIIMSLCTGIVQLIFSFVNLPQFPEGAKAAIDTYLGYVFENLDFLSFFVNVDTLKTIAIIAISLYSFKKIYKILIWIIRKLPLSID